ncbi:ribonuclease catalytic domain-containing protein [Desulfosarcina variabilis]|uniref:ribonuclease catalytic domain-containing protein n=1 Tax=Desulfosarcina variabilis TaxID=2300 RepID=UPI003AFA1BB0
MPMDKGICSKFALFSPIPNSLTFIMGVANTTSMESGEIVEYIDDQKIICAMVMERGNHRLKLLTEQNREIKLALQRLSHRGTTKLNPTEGRDRLAALLRKRSNQRNEIAKTITIEELWEILNQEQTWIDLKTMTGLCFPDETDDDHESGVIRALFSNRRYFKFKPDRFFPHTIDQVNAIIAQEEKAARNQKLIDSGAAWLQSVRSGVTDDPPSQHIELTEILKSYYLFEKESPYNNLAKAMLKKAGITSTEVIFSHLVAVGAWTLDENIDLLRYKLPTHFRPSAIDQAQSTSKKKVDFFKERDRVDLTHLSTITIDGQSTLDFDDALSIQPRDDHFLVGIHISDVAHYIKKDDVLDQEARFRGSSIYMPDHRISMTPPLLSENLLSLKKDHTRPTISTMVKISLAGDIISYDIFPSIIRVRHQLSYFEANINAEASEAITQLYDIALKFREKRLSQGAVQIILPEINVWLDESGKPVVSRINRESPGRMLIAEMMILSNWLSARFLVEKDIPAIFRSQAKPKNRLLKNGTGTLFQNWMQRKQLNRFVLRPTPEQHCGLGLDAYVTASSPIRKYFDLVTQRQLRAALGLENAYTAKEIEDTIEVLSQPMANIGRIQFRRNRYWLLKHLEERIGEKEEAIVLQRRRNAYTILLKNYMIECALPQSSGIDLKPEDLVQVTIQHVNARNNILSVFMG